MSNIIDIGQIIHEFLTREGYEGLCNPDNECGCDLSDLGTCGCMDSGCMAAHKHTMPPGSEYDVMYFAGRCPGESCQANHPEED